MSNKNTQVVIFWPHCKAWQSAEDRPTTKVIVE